MLSGKILRVWLFPAAWKRSCLTNDPAVKDISPSCPSSRPLIHNHVLCVDRRRRLGVLWLCNGSESPPLRPSRLFRRSFEFYFPNWDLLFGKLFIQVIWWRGSSFLPKTILRGNADWQDGLKRQPWSRVTEMASSHCGFASAEALWSEAVLPHNLHNRVRWWFNGFCRYLQQGCKWGRLAETNPSGTLKKNNYMKDEPQFTFQLLKSWEKCEKEERILQTNLPVGPTQVWVWAEHVGTPARALGTRRHNKPDDL